VSIYRWVQRFAPEFAEAARARQHAIGIAGTSMRPTSRSKGAWRYLFRAIDQFGQVIDVFLSPRRDAQAARRFFERAIDRTRISPVEVTTDRIERTPASSMTCSPRPSMTRRPTPTTRSRPTTDA
jgi:transposase, IS6 family